MNAEQARALRAVLKDQTVAALGTLHKGNPSVSMTPFAILPSTATFLIHVSTLAAHTKDMQAHPSVSVLVMAPPSIEVLPQALPRVSVQGVARAIAPSAPEYAEARAVYLARFPESVAMFGFLDFSLVGITPTAARFVGGFAQAASITAATLAEILGEA